MQIKISQQNKHMLEFNNPRLYEAIYTELPLNRVKIEEQGEHFIVSSDQARCYLNSVYSIEDECRMMFRSIKSDTKILILLGLGNGVAIDYVKEHYKHIKKVFVLEPTNQIIKNVLKRRSLAEWIGESIEVSMIVNKSVETAIEMLAGLLEENDIGSIHVAVSGAYVSLFPKWCTETLSTFQGYTHNKILIMNTKRYFMHRWPINIFRNLKKPEIGVEMLKNTMDTRVGILVSGGPSLEYDLDELRKVVDTQLGVVFAVGSTIKIMDSHGIDVNYRMAIDGNDGQKKIFNQLNNYNIPLIHATSSFHEIADMYPGATYKCVLTSEFLTEYIYDLAKIPHMSLVTGYSVATSALDLMIQLGFKKIILMGQDLCFSDGKHYTSGSWMNEKIEDFEEQKETLTPLVNNSGDLVYANLPFIGTKGAIEELIHMHPEVEFINTTRNGVVLEGTNFKTFSHSLVEEIIIKDNRPDHFELKRAMLSDDEEYVQLIRNGVNLYRKELKEIECISNQMLDKSETGLKSTESEMLKILLEIQILEEQMNKIKGYEKTIVPILRDRLLVISQQSFSDMEDDDEKNLMRVVSAMSEIKSLVCYYLELIAEFNEEKVYKVVYED